MLIERNWHKRKGCYIKYIKGWFLFGIIPLFIKSTDWML